MSEWFLNLGIYQQFAIMFLAGLIGPKLIWKSLKLTARIICEFINELIVTVASKRLGSIAHRFYHWEGGKEYGKLTDNFGDIFENNYRTKCVDRFTDGTKTGYDGGRYTQQIFNHKILERVAKIERQLEEVPNE